MSAELPTTPPDASADNVLRISRRNYHRSWTARRARLRVNDANWQAYRCQMDWSHKAEFQSRECTPMFPIAVEQIVGTFERALTDSDDWLSADPAGVGAPFLPPDIIKGLLKFYLDRLYRPGQHAETGFGIQALVGDACKRGILEPCIVVKVYPVSIARRRYRLRESEPRGAEGPNEFEGATPAYDYVGSTMSVTMDETMRLAIDLIPYADYFPDPSEANNFEIHRTRRQLHELMANPEYDPEAVRRLLGRATDQRQQQYDKSKTSGEQTVGADPFEIEVFEGWGNIVDELTGDVLYENCFWSWAGDEMLRMPTPNPFWDGTRPFIMAPLIRVPGSLEHKALADHVVPMWRASNELVNLLLDGAMRAAWGVGQIRPDLMESPEEVAEGMPQGYTAVLKPNVPVNAKFYERVDNGEAPQLSLEGLARMEGYVQSGLAVPDTKLGTLPDKQVKACVPMYSQALTRAGWRSYEQLAVGDEIMAVDPSSDGAYVWTPILALYYHDEAETLGYMSSQWKAVCTPNHKWLKQQYSPRGGGLRQARSLVPMLEMTNMDVLQTTGTGPAPDGPGMGALTHMEMLDRPGLPDLVMRMTSAERRAFIVGMLAGEGHVRHDGAGAEDRRQVLFTQKDGPVFDAFRTACFLEGIRTSATVNTVQDHRTGKWHTKRHASLYYQSSVWRQNLETFDAGMQPVWCPQTEFKTWVMRQGDTITVTGNTEIVSAMQASGSLYESFAARFEDTFLEPLFEKCWKVIIQWSDSFMEEELLQILGPRKMLQLMAMKPAERWQMLHKTYFKVRGLRQLANRERNFQKKMVLLQLLGTNQQFADYFGQKYDYGKLFDSIMVDSGTDPETLELDGDALAAAQSQPPPQAPIAGGQLDAALAGSSGASPQNITGPEANSGMQSGLAPANPNAGGALGQ